jgi:ELWxxDGT repeat protein
VPAGTLVRDIRPGGSSAPSSLTPVGQRLFFTATDGVFGRELWVSDGTEAGTARVRDIRPGPKGSRPRSLTAVGSRIFFTASDGVHGIEPWVSDGSPSGTRMVRDLVPGAASSDVSADGIAALGEVAIFHFDGALWRSDGTRDGTKRLKAVRYADLRTAVALSGRLLFRAGHALWATDGTAAGTQRLSPRLGSIDIDLTRFRGRAWFVAAEPSDWCCNPSRLWRSDGTRGGTRRFGKMEGVRTLSVLGKHLYFSAGLDAPRLYRSDGTPAGTGPVRPRVRPLPWMSAAGSLWAWRRSGRVPWPDTLWTSGGTAATTGVAFGGAKDWFAGNDGGTPLVGLAGRAWFVAGPGSVVGEEWAITDEELWVSDGTPSGTREALDLRDGGSSAPRWLTKMGGALYASADDGVHGSELWRIDP